MSSSENFVPIHGNYRNYHGYYYRHPGPSDPRLSLLPPGLLVNARVLDIGCNEGWVSCEIGQTWGAQRVVGVDIDDVLVRAAWKRRRTMWSQQEPELRTTCPTTPPKKKQKLETDAARLNKHALRPNYFPASCQHMFGPLPIPPANISVSDGEYDTCTDVFPHNVSFRRADWVNEHIPEDEECYDVIIAFSISKWIHLNGGDDGLRRFFRRVYESLGPGGTFVFEPQQWDSYAKARKLHPSLQEAAKSLKIHTHDFDSILTEMGFIQHQRLGVPGEGRFRRPIELYVKPK